MEEKLFRKRDGTYGAVWPKDDELHINIKECIAEGIRLSGESTGKQLVFEFNGTVITVRFDSNEGLILRDYVLASNGYYIEDKKVGPYPAQRLFAEMQAIYNRLTWAARNHQQKEPMLQFGRPVTVTNPTI
jgi:hypothetical protein